MHKIFAKPLFLGKKAIFLTECHSTNDEVAALIKSGNPVDGTVVYTDRQLQGKGQRGNVWVTEAGKNILMSIFLRPSYVSVSDQHMLNVVVGLSVIRTLSRYLDEQLIKMKWPNDILFRDKKLTGILIENTLRGDKLENSVVGIGLNVNQKGFELPNATSLAIELLQDFDRIMLMEELLVDIEYFLLKLKNGQKSLLLQLYHEKLYLKGVPATFKDDSGFFQGIILGIDATGKLIVSKDGALHNYGIKEIEFLWGM